MALQLEMLWRLVLALVLSSSIGLEREMRQKSAGLRTHTLVGVGSALFMLVSQFGFEAGMAATDTEVDVSRMAAQIVSGVGFLGAGIIFVRRDAVRGLTTAAGIWVTAAVGTAAGGGLALLALTTTLVYFVVAYAFPPMVRALPQSAWAPFLMQVTYLDGRGLLRDILSACTAHGFQVVDVAFQRGESTVARSVTVQLRLRGPGNLAELTAHLDESDGIVTVNLGPDSNGADE